MRALLFLIAHYYSVATNFVNLDFKLEALLSWITFFLANLSIIEKTDDNFDDIVLTTDSKKFQLQIKDFKKCNINDLTTSNDEIIINGKSHKLSNSQNVIFLKNINLTPNDKFFPTCCARFLSESNFALQKYFISNL